MKTILNIAISALGISGFALAAGAPDLIRLHEEEILAHDLYLALSKAHPELMPLRNIPSSEASHRKAMAAILEKEKIKVREIPEGRKFATVGLDELYKKWLEEGSKSPADACRVGMRLEEHDIADLRRAQVDFPAHKEVLAQLEAASNNHLRAFHRNLIRHGGTYQPEALTPADLKTVLEGTGQDCGCENKCGGGRGGRNASGRGPGMRGGRQGRGWNN